MLIIGPFFFHYCQQRLGLPRQLKTFNIHSRRKSDVKSVFGLIYARISACSKKEQHVQQCVLCSKICTYRVNYPQADTKLLVVAVGDVTSKLPNPLLHKKKCLKSSFLDFSKISTKKSIKLPKLTSLM